MIPVLFAVNDHDHFRFVRKVRESDSCSCCKSLTPSHLLEQRDLRGIKYALHCEARSDLVVVVTKLREFCRVLQRALFSIVVSERRGQRPTETHPQWISVSLAVKSVLLLAANLPVRAV